jgi:hypothetical protein
MASQGNSASTSQEAGRTPPLDDEMLDHVEIGDDPREAFLDLKRQSQTQARQITTLMETINQLTAQLIATPNERPHASHKPKMATPKKYEGGRTELRAFLTNIDLYYEYNEVPNN